MRKREPPCIDDLRSRTMRAVRSKNTGPEMAVRRLVHAIGLRFRLHRADLPGKPDLVFFGRRKVVFVHGCFWHGHDCKRGSRVPVANRAYWTAKIDRNRQRDAENLEALRSAAWEPIVVWECELRVMDALRERLQLFLDPSPAIRSGDQRDISECL